MFEFTQWVFAIAVVVGIVFALFLAVGVLRAGHTPRPVAHAPSPGVRPTPLDAPRPGLPRWRTLWERVTAVWALGLAVLAYVLWTSPGTRPESWIGSLLFLAVALPLLTVPPLLLYGVMGLAAEMPAAVRAAFARVKVSRVRHLSRVTRWHGGKLALCWAVVLAIVCWALALAPYAFRYNPTVGDGILIASVYGVAVGGPIALFVVTWRWFTAREARGQ